MQEQQHEGILRCSKHGVQGCVPCAENSALTRGFPSKAFEEPQLDTSVPQPAPEPLQPEPMNRHQRRVAESEARRSK